MKILLIQPPIEDFYHTSIRTKPIGLAYSASSLKKSGYEVEILDCHTEKKRSIPVPKELSYLEEFYPFCDKSPIKLYSGYYHFGIDWEEIGKRIKGVNAEIFGISSSFTPYQNEVLKVARIIKELNPSNIIVIGGAHASCDPISVIKDPCVDYVIMGEGEYRFPALVEMIEKGIIKSLSEIDGLVYRDTEGFKINPIRVYIKDLDSIPFPARELLELNRYKINKKLYTMLITSRGCPHKCIYCSAHLIMGNKYRSRSPEDIIKEMKECYENYDIEVFDFEDDNLTYDKDRVKLLMNLIIEKFGEGKFELRAMNGISYSSLDGELIKLMKKAGFKALNLSLVSSSNIMKEYIGRPSSLFDFDQILDEAIKSGLKITAYAIFGIPGQDLDEMIDTLIYLMERNLLIGPSIYYPVAGTQLYEMCRQEGILPKSLTQYRSTAFPIETKEFNRVDLVTLLRITRMINFIKAKMEKKELEDGITLKDLYQFLKSKAHLNRKKISWVELLYTVFDERSFFGMKINSAKGLFLKKERSSDRVLSLFFEKAWKRRILRCN